MDLKLFNLLLYFWIGLGIVAFCLMVFCDIKAPYGRHTKSGKIRSMDNRWGWFWMELLAFIVFPSLVIIGPRSIDPLSFLLVVMWMLHYFNRTFIFPFRLKTQGKRIPIAIVLSATFFNLINGWFNGYYWGFLSPESCSLLTWNVLLGLVFFITGFLINNIADSRLIALRKKDNDYKIPRGWLFEYVSCPNHLGELVEWIGFAIMAWNLPAASFAIWTFCNLVPRAMQHHAWYYNHFPEYPKSRKAVIPFLI